MKESLKHLVTPDGRYLVVRGRLWRCSNPGLGTAERDRLTHELMDAWRAKATALRTGNSEARESAKEWIDRIKRALGERGPVWWSDGAPDWNHHMVKNTPYADWFATALSE